QRPGVSRAEIEVLAEIGPREGAINEEEWRVLSNVIRLDKVSLGEVMTPRTDMVAVPVEASAEEAIDVMLETGHLRLPVYEGSLDQIVGIVIGRVLWRAERAGVTRVRDVPRPFGFEPYSYPVEDLIP